ncbi:MAG: nucleotidyltransferase family protein [Phototrophicaceae bacterium]
MKVGAVVLAAGLSSRMGAMKLLLAWDQGRSVIGQVLYQLQQTPVAPIIVVTGHRADEVEQETATYAVQCVTNPDYASGEMRSSLQVGLTAFGDDVEAALIVLGDQPRLNATIIRNLIHAARDVQTIVIPSYQMRRGHPWVLGRHYWPQVLALNGETTVREVLARYTDTIRYITTDDDSILSDLDTPDAYQRERARAGLPPLV